MEEQIKKWEELQNKIKAEITNLENNKTADNKKLRQLKRELDKLLKETQSLMATNIKLEVKLGANSVDSAINKLTGETLTPNRLNTPGLQDLINENALNFKSAVNYVNREINTMVREAQKLTDKINVIDTANRAEFEAELKRKMTEAGVVAMKTTDGKNLQLDKYVKMATQTTLKIARNKGVIEQCKVRGIDLVKMSEHFPTCSICTPLQGRVYSISGDSKEYPALSIPFSGGYEVVHPNCKHSFMPYLPEYLPKETVEKDKEKSNRSFEVFNQFEKEQLERYNQQQKKKATVNRIRKEYDNIALAIGKDNMPSFTGFRNSKRSNGPVYNEVKEKYNLAIGKTTENVDNYVENSVDIKYTDMFNKNISIENQKLSKETITRLKNEYKDVLDSELIMDASVIGPNTLGSTNLAGRDINLNSLRYRDNPPDILKEFENSGYSLASNGDIRDIINHEAGHLIIIKLHRRINGVEAKTPREANTKFENYNRNFMKSVYDEYSKAEYGLPYSKLKTPENTDKWSGFIKRIYPSQYSRTSYSENLAENFSLYRYKIDNNIELDNFDKAFEKMLNVERAKLK